MPLLFSTLYRAILPQLHKVVLILLATGGFNVVVAQGALFTNQQHFGVEDGLPQSYISGIDQDRDGFIWISTLDGLSRYDGRSFKTFRYGPNDATAISASTIYNLGPIVNNSITLYYDGLLADDFDLRTFKVTHNNRRIQLRNIPNAYPKLLSIGISSHNWYFLAGNYKGIGWLNTLDGSVHYANKANGLLQQDTVTGILESANGKIYLVSADGVQVSDTAKKKFNFTRFPTTIQRHPPVLDPAVYLKNFSPVLMSETRMALLDENRLVLLDLTNKKSTILPIPPQFKKGLNENARVLKLDTKGRLYFEHQGRIFRLSSEGELKLLWENTMVPNLHISTFFIDRSDVLWVSINAQGLLKIDLQAMPFHSYRYKTNFISAILDQAGANPALFPSHWSVLEMSYYFRQARDSKGNQFVCYNYGNQNEVFQISEQGFRRLPHIPPSKAIYTAMLVMPDDELRVFDQVRSVWYCWKTPTATPYTIELDEASMRDMELADARFMGGCTWIATYSHGLLQYRDNKRVNIFIGKQPNGILPKDLTEICADPIDSNLCWIGSRGGGLILWHLGKGLQKVYTTDDGLPNNTIYCILPDKNGKIWCSTNKGIFRFDRVTNQVNAFEKADGLTGNEFNRAHKFTFPDGRISFGGMEGYSIFNPDEFDIKKSTGDVPVLLTSLQVNNQPQGISIPTSFIKDPLATIKSLELPYDKNYLRFEFAALLFNQPQKTKYRYQLKGADKDWVENGTNNIASYASLQPGSYKLLINATGINGNWSNTIREISIYIRPPFWATWWAYILYAVIIAGLLRWYFVFREQRINAEQSLAFEKREAIRLREMDEVKDRFFSNITHEFRTPLTLIVTPLEKLSNDPTLSAQVRHTIKTAQKNSKQLLRLINEFLDFSKLNNGQMRVKQSAGELSLFVKECVASFENGAKEKDIRLGFSNGGVDGFYLFDEEKWEKIITNLVGNALKFTPVTGEVDVRFTALKEDCVRLEVKDNGPGIPADQQLKIFNRFYQVDDSAIRSFGGTGIGLSLVKELVELMKGSIHLESIPGETTRFIVDIPVKKVITEQPGIQEIPVLKKENPVLNRPDAELPLLLIAEDNEELRAFLLESMRNQYRVLEAADGLNAWETILQELPDIVISDVMMPGQDGYDLCRSCKTDNRTSHIGFILLTSKAAHDARLRGLETGADDYITKPFHLDELELRTANLVQLQQKVRANLQAQLLSAEPPGQIPPVTDPFLQQLYQEIEIKLEDAELGVDYLCKIMAMSRSTLNRKLKSLLDISANDLIRQFRLQKAASFLASGTDITSAAYKVGFSSPSYFTQCFREQYGITPSDYVSRRK